MRRYHRVAFLRLPELAAACASLATGCDPGPSGGSDPLTLDPHAALIQRAGVKAFYSGHSLSDGVPEAVASIAASLGTAFDYEFQSNEGSLLRERTQPPDGFRSGRNRNGSNLDVEAELRNAGPTSGKPYDVLVATERHDLPYAALHEATPRHLRQLVDAFHAGSPQGEALLYHVWLDLDLNAPQRWIAYERDALRLWECVASAVNGQLAREGNPRRVHVLPGATALVELVDDLLQGRVPGVDGAPADRLALIFRDNVHLTPAGTHFMGAVHYAALFGRSPEGAALPESIPKPLGSHMHALAYRHVRAYQKRKRAAGERDMKACREFAAGRMCAALSELQGPADDSLVAALKQRYQRWRCRRDYLNEADEHNPFR